MGKAEGRRNSTGEFPEQDCAWHFGERRLVWLQRARIKEAADEMGRWGESCSAVGNHLRLASKGDTQSHLGPSNVTGVAFRRMDSVVLPKSSCLNP